MLLFVPDIGVLWTVLWLVVLEVCGAALNKSQWTRSGMEKHGTINCISCKLKGLEVISSVV